MSSTLGASWPTGLRPFFVGFLVAAIAGGGAVAAVPKRTSSRGADCAPVACCLRAGDEFWAADARFASPTCGTLDGVRLDAPFGGPTVPSWDALASDAHRFHTFIFVHGYNYNARDALDVGCLVYRHLIACHPGRPLRMVVWIWPAERTGPILRDARAKACRSDIEGVRLAQVLKSFPPESEVSVLGYSLGARATTGALHLTAAAELSDEASQGLDRIDGPQPSGQPELLPVHARSASADAEPTIRFVRPRVMLVAAAVDSAWLAPGQRHGLAPLQCLSLKVVVNRRDPVLRRYHLVSRAHGVTALGAVGAWAAAGSLLQADVTPFVGRNHSLEDYLQASPVRRLLGELVAPLALRGLDRDAT